MKILLITLVALKFAVFGGTCSADESGADLKEITDELVKEIEQFSIDPPEDGAHHIEASASGCTLEYIRHNEIEHLKLIIPLADLSTKKLRYRQDNNTVDVWTVKPSMIYSKKVTNRAFFDPIFNPEANGMQVSMLKLWTIGAQQAHQIAVLMLAAATKCGAK